MTRTYSILLLMAIAFISLSNAKNFTKSIDEKHLRLLQSGKQKHWCPVCAMSIKKHYKTSYAVKLKNKNFRQYCSIRCLITDDKYKNIDNQIMTVDAKTAKQIYAKNAFYIIGSRVKGTMSKVSKLAFRELSEAKKFQKEYGGKIATFKKALVEAKKSLKNDIAITNKKRIKKIYPMGKKIFIKKCNQDIKISSFAKINRLKYALKNRFCKRLKPKQLQAVTLYLWDVKRLKSIKTDDIIKVLKDEKCPICGMFVYKYPKWVAQIFFKDKNRTYHYSFDGVKDMMKFYLKSVDNKEYKNFKKKSITKMLVSDYYTQKSIDATFAFYVIGSDIFGPMGKELIAFKSYLDAKIFKKDHRGVKIIKFKEINKSLISKLD